MSGSGVAHTGTIPATIPGMRPRAGSLMLVWRSLRPAVLGLLSLAIFLLLWHLLTVNRVNLYVRFTNVPTPEAVLARATRAFAEPDFRLNLWISCRRVGIGFLLASVLGVPLGLLAGRHAAVRQMVMPVMEVIRPVPAIAWVPMSIMLWPSNEESIIFITFLGSFFPILLNTMAGMAEVDSVYVRAARCLGATERALFVEVFVPAILPQIFTGMAVGMGVAWVSLIAAEMISGQFGIGYFTWEAYSLVQYSDIVLGMACIGVLGLGSSLLVRATARLCMPWTWRSLPR